MELKPAQTIAILLVFLLVGGPAAWFTSKGFSVTGPGDLGLGPDGRLYAHFHGKVFAYDSSGESEDVYNLESIGADSLWGGLSFFPNGDWLIAPEGIARDGELHRCSESTGVLWCEPLPNAAINFFRTFRTHIDKQSRFYLSDSGRQQLTLHDVSGSMLATSSERFRHPGEVKLYGEKLAIADVDNFRMRVFDIDPETGNWAGAQMEFATASPMIGDSLIKQPVDFVLHEDIWYVLVKDVSMSFANLRRYTLEGDYIDRLPLPDNDMIMAMEKLGDSLVLSDFRSDRLLRIGLDGSAMPDLQGSAWERYARELKRRRTQDSSIGIALWLVFGIFLGCGILIGLKTRKSPSGSPVSIASNVITPEPSVHDPGVQWLKRTRMLELVVTMLGVCILGSLAFIAGLEHDCATAPIRLLMFIYISPFFLLWLPLLLMCRRVRSSRLGVKGEWVLYQPGDGSVVKSRAENLRQIRNTILFVGTRKINLGPPHQRMYDKDGFQQLLEPLLKSARAMKGVESYRWRWQHDKAGVYAEASIILLVAVIAVSLLTGVDVDTTQCVEHFNVGCEDV